jgi:hypothetical protein
MRILSSALLGDGLDSFLDCPKKDLGASLPEAALEDASARLQRGVIRRRGVAPGLELAAVGGPKRRVKACMGAIPPPLACCMGASTVPWRLTLQNEAQIWRWRGPLAHAPSITSHRSESAYDDVCMRPSAVPAGPAVTQPAGTRLPPTAIPILAGGDRWERGEDAQLTTSCSRLELLLKREEKRGPSTLCMAFPACESGPSMPKGSACLLKTSDCFKHSMRVDHT